MIKWRVHPVPTGRYRSFQRRGWPYAEYSDGARAGFISCPGGLDSSYSLVRVRTVDHPPLEVWVCDYRPQADGSGFKNRRLIKRFATLGEAKLGLVNFLSTHPEFSGEHK